MNELYWYIIDYKDVHPIRFLGLISGLIIFFIALVFVINWLINTRRTNVESPVFNQEKKTIFKNHKFLISVIAIEFAVILILVGILINSDISINFRNENTSLSSSKYVFGIDVSMYQGKINWNEVRTSKHPIEFVFIRSTMGVDGKDSWFNRNWNLSKRHDFIRGAYHYYRPNENSTKQFENFKSVVKLADGDFIPILDIEKESIFGRDKLRKGVLNWLKLAEKEYGVKPMIYTGLNFYQHVLKGFVDDYPLWIAAYSGKHRLKNVDWSFHQFTEKVRVKGIKPTVDGNDFKGEINELRKMLMKAN